MYVSGVTGAPKVAVVTGCAGAIGTAVAAALRADGYAVAGIDVTASGVTANGVAASSVADGGRAAEGGVLALSIAADVADPAAVADALDRVEASLGPIDALVNVAGVLHVGAAVDLPLDDWHASLHTNATGVFVTSREAGRRMAARGRGAIVTVSSNAATTPRIGMAAYAASKAAATAVTRVLGLELARRGVRCNIVSPGSTDTPMLASLWSDREAMAAGVVAGSPEAFRLGVPTGRIGEPCDVAAAVRFLVSDAARQITLHDLRVDGGATLDA